jgi:transcriptional regulator with XRE-family HTH domain
LTKAFADHVRARRKAIGFTQEELAERSGFSTNYIARLELGMSVPSLSTLSRLSRALGVGVTDLLTNETEPVPRADVCASLLQPLNERETDVVLALLRTAVDFVLSARETKQGNNEESAT